MITSYEVGSVFRIVDQATPTLLKISEQLSAIEARTVAAREAMLGMARFRGTALLRSLEAVSKALTGTGTGAERAQAAIGSSFSKADASINATTGAVARLNAELALARRGTTRATALPAGRGTAANLSSVNKSLDGVEARLGKVAPAATVAADTIVSNFARVTAAIGTATSGVAALTAELRQAGQASGAIHGPRVRPGMNGGAGAALGGAAGAATGGGAGGGGGQGGGGNGGGHGNNWSHVGLGLGMAGFFGVEEIGHGLKDVLKHASELEHVRQQMVQAGFKEHDIGEAMAASWREAEKYGLNVAKVMADIKELVLPFGSVEHAIEFVEPLEKMRIVLNAVSEGKGNQAAESVYKMARAGELKGLQDPKDFLAYFEAMTKVISASGGKVTPNDFMQVTKYGKLSSMGWDQEFYTKYLPTLVQTMGASTAGTASMSLFSTLVQGTVTKRALGRMEDLGLIGDPSKIIYDNKGDPKGFNPGAIEGTQLLVRNPFKWAQEILLPLLEKKYGQIGGDPDKTYSKEEQAQFDANKMKAIEDLGGLFGNRNSAAAIAELALRGKSFVRDSRLIEPARGLGGADQLQKEDPNSAAARLKGAWENLLTAAGGPGVKIAVDGMNALASGITSITKWANENPGTMKIVLEAMAGLGVAFAALTVAGVVAGAALLIPGGGVALAVTTLIGVFGTIAAFNWDGLKEIGAKILDALMAPVNAIMAIWEKLQSWNPFSRTSFEGGGGIGGMIHKASLGGAAANDNISTGIARGLAAGGFNGTGVGHTASQAERADYIKKRALSFGIDPNVALRVAKSEGFGRFVGDHGTSFGDFQLHYGGSGIRGMNSMGEGDLFTRATGLSAKDPKNWRAATDWALKRARENGWGAWHGAAAVGIGRHQGIGTVKPVPMPSAAPPPVAGPPPRQQQMVHVTVPVHVGSRKVAHEVFRVAANEFPNHVGGMDTYGSWRAPGTTLTDAA